MQLVAAARDLADAIGGRVWPGWDAAGFEVLLVAGEREVLIGRAVRPPGFEAAAGASAAGDSAEGASAAGAAWRPRVFPETMLATMPVFGPPPTIVVGTPEAAGLGTAEWILVLLHEHFHQWQMRAPDYFAATEALDLAAGDTTGRWMLEYPFPYDEAGVAAGLDALSRRLAGLLRRPADADLSAAAGDFWHRWERLVGALAPADARYLRFQIWQEGVARYVELRLAEELGGGGPAPPAVAALAAPEAFAAAARTARERVFEELAAPDLAGRHRISFYSLGAGLALLLDRTDPGWKARYERPRFALEPPAID
ncbi:MAG: hypothetical protein OES32_02275 [Acidobacteriota bacterium]|nr:hypothetical protein [Acidobacteriota bacterium]MDH3522387.1 hypothetical protein [Acidobacteriota bacterium]